MKTHPEIRDAINQVQLLPDEDTNGQIIDILHALNNRIEELDNDTPSRQAYVELFERVQALEAHNRVNQ